MFCGESPLNFCWYLTKKCSKLLTKTVNSQQTFNCSKSTIETLEKGVKYVQR